MGFSSNLWIGAAISIPSWGSLSSDKREAIEEAWGEDTLLDFDGVFVPNYTESDAGKFEDLDKYATFKHPITQELIDNSRQAFYNEYGECVKVLLEHGVDCEVVFGAFAYAS